MEYYATIATIFQYLVVNFQITQQQLRLFSAMVGGCYIVVRVCTAVEYRKGMIPQTAKKVRKYVFSNEKGGT
jgi:hypothetical protein